MWDFNDLDTDLLVQLLKQPTKVERWVPAACVVEIARIGSALLPVDDHQKWLAGAIFLLMPKLVWHSHFNEGGKRPKGHARQRVFSRDWRGLLPTNGDCSSLKLRKRDTLLRLRQLWGWMHKGGQLA